MNAEHEQYMAFLNTFTNSKELIEWRQKWDKIRQQASISGKLLECFFAERKAEMERLNNMAKPRGRPAKAKVNSQAEQLSIALEFVSCASVEMEGREFSEYVKISDNFIVASTGLVSAGHPIVEELELYPHLAKFKSALGKCGLTLVLTQTPTGQLSIKGDKLNAIVPCIKPDVAFNAPNSLPDMPIEQQANYEQLKEAFKVCNVLASEAGESVVEASLLLEAYSCSSTNRAALIQYNHGIDLPPHLVLPKVFTAAVAKQTKTITGFGYSWDQGEPKPKSVTIWFDGGSWIKTMCYQDPWPIEDINRIMSVPYFPAEVPAGLFEAIEAVESFSDAKRPDVFFADGMVMSHDNPNVGAQYSVPGLQGGKRFRGKLIRGIAPFCSAIDLTTVGDKAYFIGGTTEAPYVGAMRGALMCIGPVSDPTSGRGYQEDTYIDPVSTVVTGDNWVDSPLPNDIDTANQNYENDMEHNPDRLIGNDPNVGWG